jgi:hypothetical protein
MCIIPVFQHTCGCRNPLEDAIERCEKAEEENVEQCDNVEDEVTEDPYPCVSCFEKQADEDVEEQLRLAMEASANDYAAQADLEAEDQLRAAMAASADDYARQTKQCEEDEFAKAMAKSMEGVNLEDRWEVDDEEMVQFLAESRRDFFKQQEDKLRREGHHSGDKPLLRGDEWTQRETIHDRPGPSGTQPGSNVSRPGQSGSRPGPGGIGSRPSKPFVPLPLVYNDSDEYDDEEEEERPRLPPPADPRMQTKKLETYPPNIGPDGRLHPLLLYQYLACGHDIPAGIDYSKEVGPNELNAMRRPLPGKCPRCGGEAPPPLDVGKGKAKEEAVKKPAEVADGNNDLPPEPVEEELSLAELRQKRLAMMAKVKNAGPSA